jgi:hypothetical protein
MSVCTTPSRDSKLPPAGVLAAEPFHSGPRLLAGQAAAHIFLGLVTIVLGCFATVAVIMAFIIPVHKVRETAARAQNLHDLKQISLAIEVFHDVHQMLPTPKVLKNRNDPNTAIELSWRVSMLPFVEHQGLFDRFDLNATWDGARNRLLLNSMPICYLDPGREDLQAGDRNTSTPFQYFTGPATLWPDNGRHTFDEIAAGTSNTFLLAQAAASVPWTKPEDMAIQAGQPLPLPEGRFAVAFCDGSVRTVNRANTSDAVVLQYMNPRDKNPHPPID